MARAKQRKVGDRVFYECYDGTICTAIIKDILPEESLIDSNGNWCRKGKTFKYNLYEISENGVIEDYNCLPDSDPRVKAFRKNNKFIMTDFASELRKFLIEHGAQKGDYGVVQTLNELAEEFEA